MQTIGDYLRREREARKISLNEISHCTKVSKHYLEWLEKDDYDRIPQGPYLKGYISSYATYIGINKDEALKRYDSSQQDRVKAQKIIDEIPESKNKKRWNGTLEKKRGWLLSGFTICFIKLKNAIRI